jgi:cytochrome c oxidase subunit 2
MTISNLVRASLVLVLINSAAAIPARAQDQPRTIEVTAKRFAFAPNQIHLKRGETVKLRLSSEDVAHGFFLRALKLDEELQPGKTTEVTVTPQTAGTFTLICDHFCGSGHGNMKMTVVVE